ncbi:MAG: MarR family transcriptional regulator [Duncaniella sp.]|nr:MarR family transcriptional regulator [Duncaniella sp.]
MLGTAYQSLASKLNEALANEGLDISVPEYMILRALYTTDGLQQCELGEVLGTDKGAVSRCVRHMERKGLVMTEPVSHKCVKVYVGESGRKIEKRIMEVAGKRHESLTRLLTHDEMSDLLRILKIIIEESN